MHDPPAGSSVGRADLSTELGVAVTGPDGLTPEQRDAIIIAAISKSASSHFRLQADTLANDLLVPALGRGWRDLVSVGELPDSSDRAVRRLVAHRLVELEGWYRDQLDYQDWRAWYERAFRHCGVDHPEFPANRRTALRDRPAASRFRRSAARARGAGRPKAHAARSSVRSGDSPSDQDGPGDPAGLVLRPSRFGRVTPNLLHLLREVGS
jgi:hypothetical protein